MNHSTIMIVAAVTLLLNLSVNAADFTYIPQNLPADVLVQAANLGDQNDYGSIRAMVTTVDAQSKGVHGLAYFKSLDAITWGMVSSTGNESGPPKRDYELIWLMREIQWKLLLARCTRLEDVRAVMEMKETFVRPVFGGYASYDERHLDQYWALRKDAAELLKAYANSLKSQIIAGYKVKPERGMQSVLVFNVPAPTVKSIAEAKKLDEEFTRNGLENVEQYLLRRALDGVRTDSVELLITDGFSWPPVDDDGVRDLLDTFGYKKGREQLLEKLSQARRHNLGQLRYISDQAARRAEYLNSQKHREDASQKEEQSSPK